MRPENRTGEGECYQVNRGVRAVYDNRGRELVELTLHGEPVVADRSYSVTLQGFHLKNSQRGFAIASAEFGPGRTVSTSGRDLLEEWLRGHQNIDRAIEGRLVYLA